MKNIALFLALLILLLGLTACTEQENHLETTETSGVAADACEHRYEEEVISAATCTQSGMTRFTCIECGRSRIEDLPAYGHISIAGSCTEASTCDTCGQVLEDIQGHVDGGGICINCGISLPTE